MPLRHLRMWSGRRGIPPHGAFLLRLTATFVGALVVIGSGLYAVQAHDAREIVIADGAKLQLARGQLVEDAYEDTATGEKPMSEVREVLEHIAASPGVREALVISASNITIVADDAAREPADAGTRHGRAAITRVQRTGAPEFVAETHGGIDVFEYVSRIQLGDQPYVLLVELEPVLLNEQLAALRLSSVRAMALGALLALPLLYLLGGRTLARRFRAAADQATLDGLTGLNNHRSFQEALQQEVARAQRFDEMFTLALLDVDDFKFVNDTLGHRRGDDVLVRLAAALRTGRSVDLAFRVGGDEFAVIMPHLGLDQAQAAIERLRQEALLGMGGSTISVGIAEFDASDSDGAGVRDRADTALYEAKRRGRNQVVDYGQLVDSMPVRASSATLTAVRNLLKGRRMGAAFQPIWNLDTHTVLGYEGLARPADDYGFSSPADAFAGAARLGRVDELDALCRETILARVGDLPDDVLLFLNVSPEVFDHGGEASQRLRREVEAAGLDPGRVVIELTERASERMDLVFAQIDELRDVGFLVALDDVGAGDTGLGLLAKIRPHYVKVDRTIVVTAEHSGPGRAVLAAILAYAAESGAMVIAEGIETEKMLTMVCALDTSQSRAHIVGGQGYLLGRPNSEPPWRNASSTWPLMTGALAHARRPSSTGL